jgi:hypothetical protein
MRAGISVIASPPAGIVLAGAGAGAVTGAADELGARWARRDENRARLARAEVEYAAIDGRIEAARERYGAQVSALPPLGQG